MIRKRMKRLFVRTKTNKKQKNSYIRYPKINWLFPISFGLGSLGLLQYLYARHLEKRKVTGPWQVKVYAALPLKTLSRLFGYFNEMTLPYYLRDPGYRLYAWLFGCNLEEMVNPNLYEYPNLSSFFFREINPRPISNNLLVSPADGTVLHFGMVKGEDIEQIKGVTYKVDELLGHEVIESQAHINDLLNGFEVVDEKEFANVNGIPYSLEGMFSGEEQTQPLSSDDDSSINSPCISSSTSTDSFYTPTNNKEWKDIKKGNGLFFCVVYLAPGDYHRFHSPTNWVVKSRRHFSGELYSVSPFMLNTLANLFVLNERVVLLGKWRYGFFSMIPVGATNVGSIKLHFDKNLKTNERKIKKRGLYSEISYKKASNILGGYPMVSGKEMGGFCLGSTVVLVFEAPLEFMFNVVPGQKVKYGQSLGDINSVNEIYSKQTYA